MIEYKPDNWVIIKMNGDDPHYRVLAMWSGWSVRIPITAVTEDDVAYYFTAINGSKYCCNKESYHSRIINDSSWEQLQYIYGDKVELMPEDTNWIKEMDDQNESFNV